MAKTKSGPTGPAYNVSSIFAARRDLRPASKALVKDSVLGVEEADILILLYGFRKLGWDDCRVYDDGFVNFTELKSITVYDPSLFTRRVGWLKEQNMVQVRLGRKFDPTLHGKAQQIRIAAEGITAIKPIWERYVEFCDDLLAGCSKEELAAHQKVNEHISEILRQRRDPANQVLGRSA